MRHSFFKKIKTIQKGTIPKTEKCGALLITGGAILVIPF
jgi:hypothetical protein